MFQEEIRSAGVVFNNQQHSRQGDQQTTNINFVFLNRKYNN